MNDKCRNCNDAHNGINGRHCNKLDRYVDYNITPPCEKTTPEKR